MLLLIRLCGIMFGKDIIPQDRKLGINSRIVKRGEELFLLPLAMWEWRSSSFSNNELGGIDSDFDLKIEC